MVELSEPMTASQKQTCAACQGTEVKALTRTSFVVYLRCQRCGTSWAIPERRSVPRADQPREF